MSDEAIISLCRQFQEKLFPHGWYIGLTGSCLYGNLGGGGTGKDIDIIVYPHVNPKGLISTLRQEEVLSIMGITAERSSDDEYDLSEYYIWVGSHPDAPRVDVFFMRGRGE
jgi:hypothetical protein